MIIRREWIKRKGYFNGKHYIGYFLFGIIPLYIRITNIYM